MSHLLFVNRRVLLHKRLICYPFLFFQEFAYHGLGQSNDVQSSQNIEDIARENGGHNTVEIQDGKDEVPGKDILDKTDGHRYNMMYCMMYYPKQCAGIW